MIIDCGGNMANSIDKLRKIFGDDFVHIFEPFPDCDEYYEGFKNIQLHKKAIWTYDGEVDFYMKKGIDKIDAGNSLFRAIKLKKGEDDNIKIRVPCIDFSRWVLELNENSTGMSEKEIVLKLDIEGSEYAVLDKMMKDDSIKKIDILLVEWHAHRNKVDMYGYKGDVREDKSLGFLERLRKSNPEMKIIDW